MVSLCPSKICQRIHRLRGEFSPAPARDEGGSPEYLSAAWKWAEMGRPGAEPSGGAEITQRQLLEV